MKEETKNYIKLFQHSANILNKEAFLQKNIEIAVGEVLDSVYLKLYKKAWSNKGEIPLTAETRIFFSVWVNDATLKEQKIYYNIHALKLRKLKGYAIESQKFAKLFRNHFKDFSPNWENVSVKFGPLNLMQGWISLDEKNVENDIVTLAQKFLEIEHLIDVTLEEFKKKP